MKQEAARGQRILGICFGAQLLAVALGGKAGLPLLCCVFSPGMMP